jgi:hypothetical protein
MKVSVTLPPEPIGPTLSEEEFLDAVRDPRARDVFAKLIAFAKSIGTVSFAKRSASARFPYAGTGDVKFFRLHVGGNKNGKVKIVELDTQLKKRGLDDTLAWTFARKLDSLFSGVGLKPDRPVPSRLLTAGEVAPRLSDLEDLYRFLVDELRSLTPTKTPEDIDEEYEEESDDGIDSGEA